MASSRRDWSRIEVEAIVADYLDMLWKELRGEDFNKTEHRRQLKGVLDGRTDGAIEYKHQNITAALNDSGVPGIDGYKPASNYQDLLLEVVRGRLLNEPELLKALGDEVVRAATVPTVDDVLTRLVNRPGRKQGRRERAVRERGEAWRAGPNYLLQEAKNASLGSAGEQFVLSFERARLLANRQDRLAAQVEHVSRTRGDHEGFDVLSFDSDGRERLIEVKTTAFGPLTPFFVSANQVRTSLHRKEQYQVYRVFRFRKDPHLFALEGAIERSCDLEASEFVARPA